MTVFAVSMVKDEADIVEGMVRHILGEVDHLLIADNGSTDDTRDILADLSDQLPMTVLDDPDPAYYQSDKMTRLAAQAHGMGAEWIVPVDADELWVCAAGRIGDVLGSFDSAMNVATAYLYNHFPSSVDPVDPDPFRSIVWRQRHPGALPKVAFRWEEGAVIHQGNHGVTLPWGPRDLPVPLEIRHFPYRSEEQFLRKAHNGAAAYRATDLPEDWGAHWRQYGAILERHGSDALAEVFRTHFFFLSPIDHDMIHDPAPYLRWQ